MTNLDNSVLLDPLTDRESDILNLIANGLSNPEIADRLVISVETVRWYTKQIYSKLGVHSRTQAVRLAQELGLLGAQAPLATRPAPASRQSNLPVYATAFVGREEVAAELTRLLRTPNVRLMTVVGPGGIGKTRLVVEVARKQERTFRDGIYFIPMLAVQSADEIDLTIANGIGLRLEDDKEPRAELLRHLLSRQLLLILDSFGELYDDVELVISILTSAPDVKIIVTSHSSLNLQDEWIRYLEPLDVPSSDETGDVEAYGAVQLFKECVRRVRGDFSVTDHQLPVIQICQTVQGMPLAIELAATWLKTLSVEDVAREIQQNIDFLATTQRDVEARHRSIQAVFEHSWNLLTDEEQRVFQRLSVFRGRFGLPAAGQVAGASIHVLSALVGKSFLQQHSVGLYEIHPLLRNYAERKLETRDSILLSTRSGKLQAWMAFVKGRFNRVEQAAKIALEFATAQGKSPEKGFAFSLLGTLAGIETDYERCRQLCEAGQMFGQDDRVTAIITHLGLSIAGCGLGDYGSARHHIREALKRAVDLGIAAFSLLCLPVVALVLAAEEQPDSAVELMALAFNHADSQLDWIKKWPLIQQFEIDLEAEMGSADYRVAWERGKVLKVEPRVKDLLTQF